jgi:type II secretory pathway component PulC
VKTSYLCGKDGFRNGFVKVNDEIVPNRRITQVVDGKVFTTDGVIEGDVTVVLFNGDVEIPEDLYRSMYPE